MSQSYMAVDQCFGLFGDKATYIFTFRVADLSLSRSCHIHCALCHFSII